MPLAFVLINTETGSEDEVIKQLRKISNVTECNSIYGVYDIVAKVETDNMDNLKEIITEKMRRLDKVRSTLTLIEIE